MQRNALVSLASVGLVGLVLLGAGPLLTRALPRAGDPGRAPCPPAGAPAEACGGWLGRRGVVLAVRSAEEDRQTGGGAAWRRAGLPREWSAARGPGYVVVARMGDGSIRRALFRAEPEFRSGDSVRVTGSTFVACELYRSAPFVPAQGKSVSARG